MTELLKIIFSEQIQKLTLPELKKCEVLFKSNPKASAKIAKEIAFKRAEAALFLDQYYSNSVGGVSIEKYNKAKADGTLKVITV